MKSKSKHFFLQQQKLIYFAEDLSQLEIVTNVENLAVFGEWDCGTTGCLQVLKMLKNRPFWEMLMKMLKTVSFVGAEVLSAENCYEFVILRILREYASCNIKI